MTVNQRIRQRRLELKMSSAALARAAGISRGYLSEIENGHAARPSATVLLRLAEALETSISDLLQEEQKTGRAERVSLLEQLAELDNIPEEDVQMLAGIKFRGYQPTTLEDWRYLYQSIKRSMPRGIE